MDNSRSCDSFSFTPTTTESDHALETRRKTMDVDITKSTKTKEAAPKFLSESKGFLHNLHLDLFVTMRTISVGEKI